MQYDKENIFAKIINGEIPCDKIYEDDFVLAFNDIAKAAPTHILVIPKGEYISFSDFVLKAKSNEVSGFFQKVRKIAVEIAGLEEDGFRIITNHGKDGSQSVFHFHVHILGGKQLGGLLADDTLIR